MRAFLAIVSAFGIVAVGSARAAVPPQSETAHSLAALAVPFIANTGQSDSQVAYYAQTQTGTVFVTRAGDLVYALRPKERTGPGWGVTERLLDAHPAPVAGQASPTNVSVFVGSDPARWQAHVPTYTNISLGEVYPGITATLKAYGTHVEKVFTVRPGTSPRRIRVQVRGAQRLAISPDGALVLHTGVGEVRLTPPVAYQDIDGQRRPVHVRYAVAGNAYSFRIAGYNAKRPLVIDPSLQATYLGGSNFEQALGLALNPTTGEVYVTGDTDSNDFPGTAGGFQSTPASSGGAAFVARLNPGLTTLDQATYLGGSYINQAHAIAVNATTGEVYVAGTTQSSNFPATSGGAQSTLAGAGDGFVARFNPALTALEQATYLGGGGSDVATAITLDATTGEVYVAGDTTSTDFPGTSGGAQSAYGGGSWAGDGFVARLNASLTTLDQATYLGGDSFDAASAIALNTTTGEVYVAGTTWSTNFPGTSGGAQSTFGGGGTFYGDAFLARFNATLTTLDQATYLGGSSDDTAYSVAVSPSTGDVYVAGLTESSNFPGTAGGAQSTFGGGVDDGFVARLDATLTTLAQSSFLGGNSYDASYAVAINGSSGAVYVAGFTSGGLAGVSGGVQRTFGGGNDDAFVARLDATLTTLDQATYFGGSDSEDPYAIGINATTGDVYIAGFTASTDLPRTSGGAQSTFGGYWDAFVVQLPGDLLLPPGVTGFPCTNGSTCSTGFCVDGVCCDTACGGGNPYDCQACSVVTGAAVDGTCRTFPWSCASVDAVVLPVKPLDVVIPSGKSEVDKTIAVTVRNADITARTIALAVDSSHCPTGAVGALDFDAKTPGAQSSILVPAGKTKTAKLPFTLKSAAFTSFNFKAPTRCVLAFSASAVVPGGSNDRTPANNSAVLELNVIDKNDTEQTARHETVVKSVSPIAVNITAGSSGVTKNLTAVIGNADYQPAAEKSGDTITLTATTSCTGLTLGTPVCDSKTLSNTTTVAGGATKTCKVSAALAAAQISTPNKLSPQRCLVSFTATGPTNPETAPLDPTNNSTELMIDILDKNDF